MKKLSILALLIAISTFSAAPNRPVAYSPNTTISSSDVNTDINTIYTYLQNGVDTFSSGSITNAAINSSAGIVASKLNLTTINQNISLTGSLTLPDTYLLDLSAIDNSAISEGLKLPQTTSCTSATAEGQACWDTDGDELRIGNGTSAEEIFLQAFVGNASRDTATASGTQAITGVGFKPRAVFFQGGQDNSNEIFFGFDTQTNSVTLHTEDGITADTWGYFDDSTASIFDSQSTGNTYAGEISSMDTDGFTITWTKVGSPTGTIAVDFMALR